MRARVKSVMLSRPACTLILLAATATLPLAAQRRIDPPSYEQPRQTDINLGGNNQHQTITCQHGNAVSIQGQSNAIDVKDQCRFVRIQGNRNHVFVEANSPVHVEGNENFIEVTNPDTPFSERGEHNRVERRTR